MIDHEIYRFHILVKFNKRVLVNEAELDDLAKAKPDFDHIISHRKKGKHGSAADDALP